MPAPFTRRLAGIRFVTQPPQLPERLPRMDIAAFVGFASAGPMQRPVVVEDAAQFAAIFGDDLPLAWDAQKGAQTFASLAPAVRAFFRNGGRRCWVIRVADKPETDLFPLPGLARVQGGKLHPAFAQARSPGSWFDAFRAATALAVRTIEVLGWETKWGTIYALPPRQKDLESGDLLRLRFSDERQEAFFLVQKVTPIEASPPDLTRGRVALQVKPLGTLRLASAGDIPPGWFDVTWETAPGGTPVAAEAKLGQEIMSPPEDRDDRITLGVSSAFSPPPGTLMSLPGSGNESLYFQVEEAELGVRTASPPSGSAQIVGRAFFWSDQPPAAVSSHPAGERLTFELRVRRSDTSAVRLIDLGFARDQVRFWNALPTDEQLFAAEREDEYEALWQDAAELRFPLSGDYQLAAEFIPVGMSALGQPTTAAQHSNRSALERDGLAKFSSALFLDPRLLDSRVPTLIADADFIRYQIPDAPPITGIHAALEIEEASLIAVPDAMQRGWQPTELPPLEPPVKSAPRPHPSWWHFLECDPPESPPLADGPSWGHFLRCDLHPVPRPELSVDGPDAAGSFILSWGNVESGLQFILEEATEPDFADAVEIWRGGRTNYTILSRATGTYYYRVRAEKNGESSNWSDEEAVAILGTTRWQLETAGAFQASALLEIHRSLLRFCAARGDIMAVLALPEHFREEDALAYLGDLKSTAPPASGWIIPPLGTGEAAAFSYAAVYHPWIIAREEIGGLLWMPPDGAATGLIAARSLARGPWIAPANEAFTGVVSLTPRLSPERHFDFLLAQLNIIRQEPRGFLALSADTLSLGDELRPINVRRLLILLRRAALRLGMTFVFEPNDSVLRRIVQGAFESIMQQLFISGAFAGATPEASYRVVTDDTLNTSQDFDQGRFRVDLKVAPALPMSFLTVRLVQMGERATATEII
ncbi:MAG TPA: hypothetical protein VEX43_01910 [Chthoniobacterales bacterium]|nr:hypothetical protein [Chthoniobacterales bacterium]